MLRIDIEVFRRDICFGQFLTTIVIVPKQELVTTKTFKVDLLQLLTHKAFYSIDFFSEFFSMFTENVGAKTD